MAIDRLDIELAGRPRQCKRHDRPAGSAPARTSRPRRYAAARRSADNGRVERHSSSRHRLGRGAKSAEQWRGRSRPFASRATTWSPTTRAWGTLVADARVDGRQVDVTSLQIDKPQPEGNGRIMATGSYHLDSRRYGVDLQSQNVRLLSLVLPDRRRVTGALDVTRARQRHHGEPVGTGQCSRQRSDRRRICDWRSDRRYDACQSRGHRRLRTRSRFGLTAKSEHRAWSGRTPRRLLPRSTISTFRRCRSSCRRRSKAVCARTSRRKDRWPIRSAVRRTRALRRSTARGGRCRFAIDGPARRALRR